MTKSDLTEIGEQLRAARESQQISLEQVEAETRIRLKFLVAMEAGDFDALPNPVVARGFLRSYATYLGLDPTPLLDALETVYPPPVSRPLLPQEKGKGPHVLDMDLGRPAQSVWPRLLGLVLLLALIGTAAYWLWMQGYIPGQRPASAPLPTITPITPEATPTPLPTPTPPAPTATPRPAVLPQGTAATATPTATPHPTRTATPTPSPTPTVLPRTLRVRAVITDRTWLRVVVDGEVVQEGLVEPDTELEWEGRVVDLRTGNAGGLHLYVNGEDLGVLGEQGEVQHWVFTLKDGKVQRLTPTPTPETS